MLTSDRLVVVTDREQARGSLLDVIAASIDAGARAVWLQEPELGEQVLSLLAPVGGALVTPRKCHSVDELREAAADQVGCATLSPIWPTESKPGYGPALGLDALAEGCAAVPSLPVFALGGVLPGRAAACLEAGAAGVAVMGAIMRADDPGKVVRELIEGLEEPET